MSNTDLKELVKQEKGFVSLLVISLLLFMTLVLANVARLSEEDHKAREFIMEKTKIYNQLISAANEQRWQVYNGNVFLKGTYELAGKEFNSKGEMLRGEIVGEFYPFENQKGGQWYFYTYNQKIMPAIRWLYEVDNHKVIKSRWAP